MGREIIFEVHDEEKCIWPNPDKIDESLYVCGRDDATNYIAELVQNKIEDILESNKEITIDDLDEDSYSILLSCKDYDRYLEIKSELKRHYDADQFEINKAKQTLLDLKEARRHCSSYNEFIKFSDAMEDTCEWIKHNDWSRAGYMIDYLDKCYNKMLEIVNSDPSENREAVIKRYKVAIIWSE